MSNRRFEARIYIVTPSHKRAYSKDVLYAEGLREAKYAFNELYEDNILVQEIEVYHAPIVE